MQKGSCEGGCYVPLPARSLPLQASTLCPVMSMASLRQGGCLACTSRKLSLDLLQGGIAPVHVISKGRFRSQVRCERIDIEVDKIGTTFCVFALRVAVKAVR